MTDQHPLTETAAAELWTKHALNGWDRIFFGQRTDALNTLRAAFDAGREYGREHADPHHDPRPWEVLAPGDPLNNGDEVRREWRGITTTGTVSVLHGDGQAYTRERGHIGHRSVGTWYVRPAPTPPAIEVELPDEYPAHLLDVEAVDGDVCAHMALARGLGWWGVDQNGRPRNWPAHRIAAFTLPDGTRARRDGKREDGRPRFVKVQEEA